MKFSLAISAVFLLSLTTAAPHEKRQTGSLLDIFSGNAGVSLMGALKSWPNWLTDMLADKPTKVTDIEGQKNTRPNSKHKRYWFGPYDIPAGKSMDGMESHTHEDTNSWKSKLPFELQRILTMMMFFNQKMDSNSFLVSRMITGFPKNATIINSKILLVDESGTPLGIDRGIYQHHVNMIPVTQNMLEEPSFAATCPEQDKSFYPVGGYERPIGMDKVAHVFAAQAVENFTLWYTTPELDAGYHSDGSPVMMGAEIVNYNPTKQKVYIAVDMEYIDGQHGLKSIVMPLSVTGCLTGEFGYFSDKVITATPSGKFPIFNDGVMLAMHGHLHDGGDSVALFVNGKKSCESVAKYGGPGAVRTTDGHKWETISSMSSCSEPIPVKKGDKLEIEANYDLQKHPLRLGTGKGEKMEQMGLMWFTFIQNKTNTKST